MTSVVFYCESLLCSYALVIWTFLNAFSLSSIHAQLMASIFSFSRHYLKEEHKAKKGRELDSAKWTVGSLRATVSQTEINVTKFNFFFFYCEINVFTLFMLL